jgi:hypothetical protein
MEPLFQRKGKPLVPMKNERDEVFARYGWARSSVFLRGQSQPMPGWPPTSLMLKCRALFGLNIRADVFAWLVAHGQGTASGLARELGYSQRRVQDTLMEMQLAELFQTRYDGNRKEYSLDANKGWQLIVRCDFGTRILVQLARVWPSYLGCVEEGLYHEGTEPDGLSLRFRNRQSVDRGAT